MPFEFPGFNPFRGNPFGQAGQDYQAPSPFEQNYFQQDEDNNPFAEMNNPLMRPQPEPEPQQEYQEGPLMTQYKGLVNQPAPQREDFAHPGKVARIGAILGAIGERSGYQGAKDILDRPYNQAVIDRERGVRELERGAKLEQETGQEAWRREKEGKTLAQGERRLDIDAENKRSLAERRRALTTLQDWRAKNPGYDKVEVKGGNLYAMHKGTGEMRDTGISAGTMTQEDLLETNNTNRLEQIAAGGAQARATERVRQEGRVELNDARNMSSQALERLRQEGRLDLEDAKVAGREKLLQFSVDHPKYTKVEVRGGNYHFVNPNDPTDSVNSGISTGTLSEDDSIVKRLGGGTSTVTTVNPEGTQRTVKTTRTPGTVAPTPTKSTPTNPTTPTASAKPKTMTDPEGGVHDTTKWTDRDFQQAKLRNWK